MVDAHDGGKCCESVNTEFPLGLVSEPLQCFHQAGANATETDVCLSLQHALSSSSQCSSTADCTAAESCLTAFIPHPNLSVLRIYLGDPAKIINMGDLISSPDGFKQNNERIHDGRVVVFVGDARTIFDDVRVGCILPRSIIFPVWLPYIVERLLQ